jgi:hypothetical protein
LEFAVPFAVQAGHVTTFVERYTQITQVAEKWAILFYGG